MLCVALAALAIAVAYSLEFSCNANYKRAPRLWLGDEIRATALMREASRIELNDKQCHYVTTVLRLRKGDVVRAFGARLGEYASTLHIDYEGRRRKASLAPFIETRAPIHRAENVLINKVTGAPADLQSPIEVYFAPLRKKRTALLVEKAVELGATCLRSVKTEFTEKAAIAALERGPIHPAAVEAAEQCERLDVPLLYPPVSLADIRVDPAVRFLVCLERRKGCRSLMDSLLDMRDVDLHGGLAVFVGPEGGFSDGDLVNIAAAVPHATYVSLGPSILRSETATLAALALVSAARCRAHGREP